MRQARLPGNSRKSAVLVVAIEVIGRLLASGKTLQPAAGDEEGVKIPIYICWSITSNREWGLPFGPGNDFGLYHIDLDSDPDLKRVPTTAVEVYKGIIKQHGGG